MRRLVLAAISVGIAILVAAGAYLVWSLDARVARAIEAHGTRIVGTKVHVDSVDLDLRAGRGTIHGVRVANPDGYSSGDAISLVAIELAIDASSIGSQPLRVTRVRVGDSVVNFELRADGGSNIEHIRRHISGESAGATEEPAPPVDPQRFAIGDFAFAGGEIFLVRPGVEVPERVHMPGLEMRDVGGGDGATGGEVGKQIARAFTRRVVAATAGHQLGRAVEKELGETAGEAAESILRQVLD